jgi:hypothetical protein
MILVQNDEQLVQHLEMMLRYEQVGTKGARTKIDMAVVTTRPARERGSTMNMSYCRFQNTLMDLRDCQEAMDDRDLSEDEAWARKALIEVCWRIAQDYADQDDEDEPTSNPDYAPTVDASF